MENSFAAQLFKNLLWTRVRDGGCRESVLKDSLGILKPWTEIMEINDHRCSLWGARASPAHPSRSRGPGAAGVLLPLLVLQPPALCPGAAPARLFSTAKQKECEIKGVTG